MDKISLPVSEGLIIFLMIMLFGYIFVEIIFGDKYFLRKSLERYNYSCFNRLFHYLFWGILINLVLIILYKFWNLIEFTVNVMGYKGENAIILSYFLGFIIIFGVLYLLINLLRIIKTKVLKCDFIKKRKGKKDQQKKIKLKIKNQPGE